MKCEDKGVSKGCCPLQATEYIDYLWMCWIHAGMAKKKIVFTKGKVKETMMGIFIGCIVVVVMYFMFFETLSSPHTQNLDLLHFLESLAK
jgi:hypothetical protein